VKGDLSFTLEFEEKLTDPIAIAGILNKARQGPAKF
jgi:hypothetical protein